MARYRTTAVRVGAVLALIAAAVIGCAALEPWDSFGPARDGGAMARDAGVDSPADAGAMYQDDADYPCSQKATESACESCCNGNHEASIMDYMGGFYGCVCQSGVCLAQCATSDCADGSSEAGDPCYTCETDASATSGPCSPQITCAESLTKVDCIELANCYNNCP